MRVEKHLPKTQIETDSYVAVQLLEQQGKLNFDSLKSMAESVHGSFCFTALDEDNTFYLVKGSNPMCLLHFAQLGLYIYASMESILKKALQKAGFHKYPFEVLNLEEGTILKIDRYGFLTCSTLRYRKASGSASGLTGTMSWKRSITRNTEDEVYFKATKWLKGIEEEERNPYTVREAMLQFIDSRSRVLEPTTLCCYREMLRNKLQYIMDIKIEDLTARDIQIAINVDAQRLGYKSIKNAVGFLRAVLNANDITIKMGSIRLPKKEVRERRLPSADVIYAIVKGTSSELPVLLAMNFCLASSIAALIFCMVALSLFGIRRVTLYFGVAPS